METRVARGHEKAQNRVVIDLDDLDELQVVTKREYRRGYLAQVNGNAARLRYRKLMRTLDGQYVVCRPAIGKERFKIGPRDVARSFGLFFVVAWPITVLVILALVGLIGVALR
jgi:hypothetical protein